MGAGVPTGAASTNHDEATNDGYPCSMAVGICGRKGERWRPVTANGLQTAGSHLRYCSSNDGTVYVAIGALLVQGITPGPQLVVEQPAVFWGVIAIPLRAGTFADGIDPRAIVRGVLAALS